MNVRSMDERSGALLSSLPVHGSEELTLILGSCIVNCVSCSKSPPKMCCYKNVSIIAVMIPITAIDQLQVLRTDDESF